VDWWLSCLPLDTRFAGSNLANDDGFLRAIKSVARLHSEGGDKIFYGILKSSAEYEKDTSSQNSRPLLAKFLHASLLGV
jgi:hypothetical protein